MVLYIWFKYFQYLSQYNCFQSRNYCSKSGSGILIEDDSHPVVSSNLIYGFDIGINANSDIYVMKFNLTNNVNINLSGDGLPDQAGEMATVNINGDESDIYGNIKWIRLLLI